MWLDRMGHNAKGDALFTKNPHLQALPFLTSSYEVPQEVPQKALKKCRVSNKELVVLWQWPNCHCDRVMSAVLRHLETS